MTRTERIEIAEKALAEFVAIYPGNDQMGAQIEIARAFENGEATAKDLALAFERIDRATTAMVSHIGIAKYRDAHSLLVTVRATLAFSEDLDAARDLAADAIVSPAS